MPRLGLLAVVDAEIWQKKLEYKTDFTAPDAKQAEAVKAAVDATKYRRAELPFVMSASNGQFTARNVVP